MKIKKKNGRKKCKNLAPPGLHAPDLPCVLSNRSVGTELARTEEDIGHMYLKRNTGQFFFFKFSKLLNLAMFMMAIFAHFAWSVISLVWILNMSHFSYPGHKVHGACLVSVSGIDNVLGCHISCVVGQGQEPEEEK